MPTIKIEVEKLESGELKFQFDESQKELLKLALGLGGKALLEACLDGAVIRYCTSATVHPTAASSSSRSSSSTRRTLMLGSP